MKILVTGINGFAASHLAHRLLEEDNEVHGTVRVRSDLHRIEDIKDKLNLHLIELTDAHSVFGVINKIKPDQIYHLAAQSYVRSSWDTPLESYRITVEGTINIYEACRKMENKPKILVASSSEIYGGIGELEEGTPAKPNTHYGISKYAQDLVAQMYWNAYKIPTVITRACNVTGGKRCDVFVDSNFARQIVEIEKGLKPPVIRHGNLSSERDFTDVEDVVDGYISAMNNGGNGEVYVLGSGKTVSIQSLLDLMVGLSTIKDIKTEIDPERFRPVDVASSWANSSKAKNELGWEAKIPFTKSCEDLLNYWRNRL
jgi:GDP-4-dehydro-6-deoxy-D-mannose reductase